MGLGLRQNPASTTSITSGSTTDTVSSTATPTSSSEIEAASTSTSEPSTSSSTSTLESSTSTASTSESSTSTVTSTSESVTPESVTSTVTSTSDSFTPTSTSSSMSSTNSQPTSTGTSQDSNVGTSSTSTSISSSTTDSSSTTSSTSDSSSSSSTSSSTSTTSTSTTSTSTTTSTTSSSSSSTTTTTTTTTSTSSTSSSSTSSSSPPTSTSTSGTTTSPSSSFSAATSTETSSSSPIAAVSTTTAPAPTTTFQTTVFVTTTDSSGRTTTSAPSQVTFTSTSTSDGTVVTITAVGANPTLGTSSDSGKNSFLQNTPAVAGVSVLAGLAATSIIIFLAFYIRRRRRRARIEHDTAVNETLAAAGFTRKALDDDIDDGPGSTATGRYRDSDGDPFGANRSMSHSAGSGGVLEMGQRSSSHLSGRNSAYSANAVNTGNGYNPYAEFGYAVPMGPSASSPTGHPPSSYVPPGSGPGYIPVASGERGSPVPGHSPGPSIGGSAALGERGHGHNASAGSYEPLLGAWWSSQGQTQSESATKDEPIAASESKQEGSQESGNGAPMPPPRNPRRLIDSPAQPAPPPPMPSSGHQSKPSEDLLGLGPLSDGKWGTQGPAKNSEGNDDASSFYSNDSDHINVAKMLQSRARNRAQGLSKARREGAEDESLFGDHEDYSQRVGGRGVLGVRNATDLDRERSVRSSMDS